MLYNSRLKELREALNLSQEALAEVLQIDVNTYGPYERESDIMPIKHLNTLCNYFDVSVDYIFSFSDVFKYENSRSDVEGKLSGFRLKMLRKEKKLTQSGLGDVLKCSYGTIAGYESGRYVIATAFLFDLCKIYGVSADYILGKTDTPVYLK